MNEEA